MNRLLLQSLLVTIYPFMLEVLGIIGGLPVAHYPFFVTIQVNKNSCGGTLIASDAVLTASKCLYHFEKQRYANCKEIEIWKRTEQKNSLSLSRLSCGNYVIMNYIIGPMGVAVIKLRKKVDLEKPEHGIISLCSNSRSYKDGFVIGMGVTGTSAVQVEAHLYLKPNCEEQLKKYGIDVTLAGQVCYGSINENVPAGVCYGDFGGPIISKNWLNSQPICLIGVASFNSRTCNNPRLPSVFHDASLLGGAIEDALRYPHPLPYMFYD